MAHKQIIVVGAVIVHDNKVLCAQRGPAGSLAGLWEFPGGKIESGESQTDALIREIKEELSCDVVVGQEVTSTDHMYDFGMVSLTTFYCALVGGSPQASEHSDLRWLDPSDLKGLEWAPADLPAVQLVSEALTS